MFGLEKYDPNKRLFLDVETISWDDNRKALRPYHGDRITTVIIGQEGVETQAFPIRNRNASSALLPLDTFLRELRDLISQCKLYANLNVKFDMRCLAQDKVFFPKDVVGEDTGILARLVNNNQMSFSLEDLCVQYQCQQKKSDMLAQYLGKSKDYGIIPTDILNIYGVGDVDSTMELHGKLLALLPEESAKVWDIEKRIVKILFGVEHRGLPIDAVFLKKRRIRLIQEMILLMEKIKEVTGGSINNPASNAQVAAYFIKEGIDPVLYNEPTEKMKKAGRTQGNASWNADALEQINHPVATILIDYKERAIQESTFCAGWMAELDDNNRVHPDIKSNGTKTGRPSSSNPNVYNPPKWIMEAITIPDGMVGVKWDKAQIEYRIFAHYAEDPELLEKYKTNPRIDYHQILADRLGIPRDPVKRINFGVLYGMGQAKTKRRVAAEFGELERSEKTTPEERAKIRAALRRYVKLSGRDLDGKLVAAIGSSGTIPPEVFEYASEAILAEYHSTVPAVKSLGKRVKNVISVRGYIKNYFGRRYYYPPELAYIALNALIQGTAADFFKQKLVELFEACDANNYPVELVDMIYDSCFSVMPIEYAQAYWDLCQRIVCDSPFNVPVLIDGEVAVGNWGNITKIQNNDVLGTAGLICKLS